MMTLTAFTLQDWITIGLLIGQAGILFYRLKKVEQATEKFTEMMLSIAVLKNSFEHQKKELERFSMLTDRAIQKIDKRVSGIETQAYKILIQNEQNND